MTVYLDYNATSPVYPVAIEAMQEWLPGPYNASSIHLYGRRARAAIEDARIKVAELVNAAPGEVIFTASGSEANNLAIRGVEATAHLVSAIEHPSVLKTAGEQAIVLPVDTDGVVRIEAVESALELAPRGAFLSVMLANNETGVIQPIAELTEIAHHYGAVMHCDASQAVGKIPVDVAALGVDLLTFSAHKLGGPQGAAALIVRHCLPLTAQITGGGQERNRRAGTENVAAIVGFGAAATQAGNREHSIRLAAWRDAMEVRIREMAPDTEIFGAKAPRLPGTSCLTMRDVSSETQLMAFDLAGIAVSAGSACSSGKVELSHVLRAMGASDASMATAVRVSGGWNSREEDFQRFVHEWHVLHQRTVAREEKLETINQAA